MTVALLRIGLGALLLACLPGAARLPPAHALPSMLVLGLTIMAIPFASIAVAEQTISSAVAGMLQGLAPLTTALIAVIAFKEPLGGRHYVALALGTTGVILVSLSSLTEGSAEAVGVALMILAVASYGVGFNLAARLQPIYGGLTTTRPSLRFTPLRRPPRTQHRPECQRSPFT